MTPLPPPLRYPPHTKWTYPGSDMPVALLLGRWTCFLHGGGGPYYRYCPRRLTNHASSVGSGSSYRVPVLYSS